MRYQEIEVERTTVKEQYFESIADMNEYLSKAIPNRFFQGESLSSQERGSGFSNTSSYQEAEELFAKGWTVFAEKLSKNIPVQTANAMANRSKPSFGVIGSQASVPRFLQGIPTNMVDRKTVQQKQKVIVLNKNIGFSASTNASIIEKEGLKSLQVIQLLENKGYRVKLNMFFITERFPEALAFRVTVKKPDERFSLLKIAFPIAHPAMLRRIGFHWIESHPNMTRREFVAGYGSPAADYLKNLVAKTEYILPNFIDNVEEYVKKLGL